MNLGEAFYVMELMEPAPRSRDLLLRIEEVLTRQVWCRPARGFRFDLSALRETMRMDIPEWILDRPTCLTHGDPTVANALCDGERLVVGDPAPPRLFTPEFADVDCGKILQSAFGWEIVERGVSVMQWDPPLFWDQPDARRRALFWCAVACRRILTREMARKIAEQRPEVILWADETTRRCLDAAGI